MRFAGKVALITGGGTGLGAAIARRFVADGGRVVLLGRRRDKLEQVGVPLGAGVVAGDAGDRQCLRVALDMARSEFGRLDVLIANAGGHGLGSALDTDDAEWSAALHANLTTAFVSVRECLPALMATGGNVVIVSSIAGLFSGPEVVGYVTSKHALIGLTRSIARDYGPRGVRINALCPGWIRTAMADEQMEVVRQRHKLASTDEAYQLVTRHVPLRRPAEADEVANVACFLASSEASMMCGSVVVVDGGAGTVDLPTLGFAD
ncbi:MAG: SDR family oxidoreductase [Gammaproteobacteria bacterium]|nr:SDR family oxidoreductase [Gammaproteobacteria bacterium]